eukprot:2731999-Amphidinium_carterae.1
MPLPWETNHWLSMVLDEPKSILDFPVIREPPEHLTWPQPVKRLEPVMPSMMSMPKRKTRKAALEARSLVGRQLQAVGGEEDRMQSLVDSLAEKSTSTLGIRALDFGRFLSWVIQHGLDDGSVTELVAYQYTSHLRTSGAAKSSIKRFAESL